MRSIKPLLIVGFSLSLYMCRPARIQDSPENLVSNALDRRTVLNHDTLYLFYARDPEYPIRADLAKTYFWFRQDTILRTVGGYGGRLLDGEFKAFYPNKNLKEYGVFNYGLKDGEWKTWNPDGSLRSVSYWKKGIEK